MTTYQVTARFDNVFEVVGKDEYASKADALSMFEKYENTGRAVHLHEINGGGSRLIKEANKEA